MPGYVFGHGAVYIAYLLGLYNGPLDASEHSTMLKLINKKHPDILELLKGPHGWAILQMLIARKTETLTDEENCHG